MTTISDFQREVHFAAAYDKRAPEPSKNYGIHGVHITFTVKRGGEGLTFSLSTNWQLPHVQEETDARPYDPSHPWLFHKPQPFGVDYHFREPEYDDQHRRDKCEVTGAHCYSDGSALLGDDFMRTLIEGGDAALFARMEQQFLEWRSRK